MTYYEIEVDWAIKASDPGVNIMTFTSQNLSEVLGNAAVLGAKLAEHFVVSTADPAGTLPSFLVAQYALTFRNKNGEEFSAGHTYERLNVAIVRHEERPIVTHRATEAWYEQCLFLVNRMSHARDLAHIHAV